MRALLKGSVLGCLALAVVLAMGVAAEAGKGGKPKSGPVEVVIDFSGLLEGQVIDQVFNGAGASGLPGGFIGVFGFNPLFGVGTNAAVVFDSSCPPGGIPADCSGKDPDLGTPNETFGGPGRGTGGEAGQPFQNATPLFNVAIVAEDLVDADGNGLVDDPDDADVRDEFVEFDFRHIQGLSEVTVNRVTYLDNDRGEFDARLEFFGSGTLNPSTIGLTRVGDNGVNTLVPGIENVSHMRVVLDGSGAVPTVVVNGPPRRPCWVTTGGFDNAGAGASGKKTCTFGGNIGPPPSGAFELNWHEGPFAGSKYHTNDIRVVECTDESGGPGQPGGKKGLKEDTLYFVCDDGKWNGQPGYTCSGFLHDGGEPNGKKGDADLDAILFIVDGPGGEVARCEGTLDGGNVQIHPPVGN